MDENLSGQKSVLTRTKLTKLKLHNASPAHARLKKCRPSSIWNHIKKSGIYINTPER